MQLQEDDLVRLGHQADALLGSEVFDRTINDLVNQSFQSFCNSEPGDTKARELAFNHYRALVDIVSTLRQRVTVKDEIEAKTSTADSKQEGS